MPDITLRWVAATDANVNTDYKIEADKTNSGTFETVATQNSTKGDDEGFTPTTTTLSNSLTNTDTTIILANETNFGGGDYILAGREMIILGNRNIDTYTDCIRGVGGTIPAPHDSGSTVYEAHESYTDLNVSFGSRRVIRYRIKRLQGSDESIGAEVVVVNPPEPTYTSLCSVWGIMEDISGTPQSGMTVKLTVSDGDNFGLDTGESIRKADVTTTTDADGFFSFYVRRDVARGGGDPITLTIDPGGPSELVWAITNVPDQSSINYLLT